MDPGEGKVPEHESQLADELPLQPLDGPEGRAAVGALVVPVLDQGDRGVLATAPMVTVEVHRRPELIDDRTHHHITSSTASLNPGGEVGR
jgi:hypothetical protein